MGVGILVLKPQDVVILLRLILLKGPMPRFADLAGGLALSVSETHQGFTRLIAARLCERDGTPRRTAAEEFLIHGVKYVYPAERGQSTRGVPTGFAAPPLAGLISRNSDPPPVWPFPNGDVRGYELAPLYKGVPTAAMADSGLYRALALLDAVRDGTARERALAETELAGMVKGG